MKNKNFRLLEVMHRKGRTQCRFWMEAGITSEARLSRIINYLVTPSEGEINRICEQLGASRRELGFLSHRRDA